MIRIMRRALRQWKREFLAFWERFTAFHRIVIGILLAMGIVFVARARLLDPLERELAALLKDLDEKGVPALVPEPAQDETIQEDILRAENLRRSLETHAAALAAVEAANRHRIGAAKADGNATLLGLAGRRKLRVRNNKPLEAPADGPVPAAASVCELAGTYSAIYGFLDDMYREPLLWELRDMSIGLPDAGTGPGTAPGLVLSFTLVQHLYPGGRE